ncbi:unnamed protein product [Ceratitis capitata]|uniref:(Mediterranean fruit fly) hypothetical protein n=1 Tax=Ceratitis capitata TaxID=7213 RepID=A0A811UV12_CERCA|nr:unnamed protein product [Ceratitis capitata]
MEIILTRLVYDTTSLFSGKLCSFGRFSKDDDEVVSQYHVISYAKTLLGRGGDFCYPWNDDMVMSWDIVPYLVWK